MSVSKDAVDLLKMMFNRDTKLRPSATQCLRHEWFKNQLNKAVDLECKNSALNVEILSNLRQFNAAKKMQQAAMNFIQTNLVDSREKEKLRRIFVAMDTDFDGKLTKEEIVIGLSKMGLGGDSEAEAISIFEQADLDQDGFLSFNEWCTASMDKQKLLQRPRLFAAFQMLDKDGSGEVSYDEVKEILENQYTQLTGQSDEVFYEMIQEVDNDGDGQISF